ncbi:hypothetical protein EIP91_004721 [Steccherinum ochraceum]|uniref:Protein YOP1 n=1 Tax=Steccherinum ochraceum TaxID=92696 RepID=A0A4R0RBB7_9APHY|nr:hypothetical protein EIP91_004721 [Steccherinum ochraceum]
MPLVLPILRAFWVFSNVFESFKTLKAPPPSSRNGGHPTVRAMSQRKRNMKGCMTVWLVWCCFATYERTLDGLVGIFIPFYSEIKSLVILFFLLTRARGAEPIYLHVLRPVVKPYVATLDVLLNLTHTLGDFLLVLAGVPVEFVMSFYRPSAPLPSGPQDHPIEGLGLYPSAASANSDERNAAKNNGVANGTKPAGEPTETAHGAVRARRRPLESAHTRTNSGRSQAPPSRPSSRPGLQTRASGGQVQAPATPQHKVWVPPQAVYAAEGVSGLPTPPREQPPALPQDVRNSGDDWRKYEPFPSAYPSTPLVTTSSLPSDRPTRETMSAISEEQRLDEPGDWRHYEPFPSAYPATPLNKPAKLPQFGHHSSQNHLNEVPEESMDVDVPDHLPEQDQSDFQESLGRPHESMNPNSAADSGDDNDDGTGADYYDDSAADEEDMDTDGDYVDEEDEDEDEDDFDVTLRTPARISRTDNISKASSTLTDTSTGLSTVDNGSPFRTRTNSEASTLLNGSDSSSVAGHKRSLPSSEVEGRNKSAAARKPALGPKKVAVKRGAAPASTARTQPRAVPARRPTKTPTESSSTLDESESDVGAGDSAASAATKKRRVVPAARGSRQVRRGVPGRSVNDRTIKATTDEVPVPAGSESGTVSNTGPIRANSKNPRIPASRPSIRSLKTQQSTDQAATESSVGDGPVTRTSRLPVTESRTRGSVRR